MNTLPKKKPQSKKPTHATMVSKETLVALFQYSSTPGKSQAKLWAKALVCSSFIGIHPSSFELVEFDSGQEWLLFKKELLLPLTSSAVTQLMGEMESNDEAEWASSDLHSIPNIVESVLKLDKDFQLFFAEIKGELMKSGAVNQYRVRHKLKADLGIEVNESAFVEAYCKRIQKGLHEQPKVALALTRHALNPTQGSSTILASLESFAI